MANFENIMVNFEANELLQKIEFYKELKEFLDETEYYSEVQIVNPQKGVKVTLSFDFDLRNKLECEMNYIKNELKDGVRLSD